jgi:hypothetical protein
MALFSNATFTVQFRRLLRKRIQYRSRNSAIWPRGSAGHMAIPTENSKLRWGAYYLFLVS